MSTPASLLEQLFASGDAGELERAALNLLRAVLTFFPLTVLPFAPEQSVRHYLYHVLYAATQLPALYLALAEARAR